MIKRSLFICVLTGIGGCSANSNSTSKDIFLEDQDPELERRRQATTQERNLVLYANNCTAHLLSPNIAMSAAHCDPQVGQIWKSGHAINTNGSPDAYVTEILEIEERLDYIIVKLEFENGLPVGQVFPRKIITSPEQVSFDETEGRGEDVYTVGFPSDKSDSWGATYAEGRLKKINGANAVYNIGIINGNSGGPVYTKAENALVSLTNGGPRGLNWPGWNEASANDSSSWNNGVGMWKVYSVSPVLRDIFPNGVNRFFGDVDVTPPPTSELCETKSDIEVCQNFLLTANGQAQPTLRIRYNGFLSGSESLSAYVKLNNREKTVQFSRDQDAYEVTLTPTDYEELFQNATRENRTNKWRIELAFMSHGGNWDSNNSNNHHFVFEERDHPRSENADTDIASSVTDSNDDFDREEDSILIP